MTNEQKSRCHQIIHTAAAGAAAAGAGLAQVPGSDSLIIVPIQMGMIEGLGVVFGIHIGETTAKAMLTTCLATIGGRAISQFVVGWIPGVGNIINATTAASITEGIGWLAAKDFDARADNISKLKITPQQEVITNEYLKTYDKHLIEFIKSKELVNETQITNLMTGRLNAPHIKNGLTSITSLMTGRIDNSIPYLVIYDNNGNSKTLQLQQGDNIIGRSDSESKEININLACFDSERKVSRKHAIIYTKLPGEYFLEDTGSSNGTYLNRQEIKQHKPYRIGIGDEICFGKTKVIFSTIR